MSRTTPPVVFLIDPLKPRRDVLELELQMRFQVMSFGSVADAVAEAATTRPDAVVFSLKQIEGHGLAAASVLRKEIGPKPFVAVIGEPDTKVRAEVRAELMRRTGVDWWRSQGVESQAIDALLWAEVGPRSSRSMPESVPPPAVGGFERLRAWAAGLLQAA